jgi:hypothetical protein
MGIGRRDLLGLGAAVALAAATSACRDTTPYGPRATQPAPRRPPPVTALPPRAGAFPGQPPLGQLYYGASVPDSRSLPAWEARLGTTLALNRSYFTPDGDETVQLVRCCRQDLARRRMPHVSMKPAGTWAEVASGARDDWLAGLLKPLGDLHQPLFLTINHEPENDAGAPGMQASDFVAMQRHAIALAKQLAPLVTVVPVLQHWTFDPLHHHPDPGSWLVEEASAIGLDVYNPWSPVNGKEWMSLGTKLEEVRGWFGRTPLLIGEYGCRIDPANPGLAAEWLRDAAEYARVHGIVAMSYFNSPVDAVDGTWELVGETERAFADLLGSSWVARPA